MWFVAIVLIGTGVFIDAGFAAALVVTGLLLLAVAAVSAK